ncbi:MAG TPA: hypothetical protein VEL82_01180 [Thermoplasmata archaeon]|nr:hypothetical protein [Thermoplasmata archaeon]
MASYGSAHGGHGHVTKSPISVAWVVLAALLGGAGIFLIFEWLFTFNWVFFPGIALVIGCTLMLLDRRAGLDHA